VIKYVNGLTIVKYLEIQIWKISLLLMGSPKHPQFFTFSKYKSNTVRVRVRNMVKVIPNVTVSVTVRIRYD